MNNKIKFRGWDLVNEQMLPVESINFRENYISLNEGDNSLTDEFDMIKLMQFTGKIDEYKKEIYVGDIISDRPNGKYLCEVIYDTDLMSYATKNLKTGAISYLSEFTYSYIRGNIYENSNLLSVL